MKNLVIKAKHNEEELNCLIDTSAQVSLINYSMVNKLKLQTQEITPIQVELADRSFISINQETNIDLIFEKIPKTIYKFKIMVI